MHILKGTFPVKLMLLAVVLLMSSDAQQAATVDAHAPVATYHVVAKAQAQSACGPEAHFVTSAPVGRHSVIVKCARVSGREVVVQSVLDVPTACGGFNNIIHTEVFEDGSILAHCRKGR